MDMMSSVTVTDKLKGRYREFSASEKRIADFIMENPEGAVNCNVSELANASGTSDATIIRFCKHAGYTGYYQLRVMLSRELGRIDQAQEPNPNSDTVSGILQKYASDIAALGRNLDDEVVNKCAGMIENCHYIHIVATGNTTPLANYMGFRLGRLGIHATYHSLPEYTFNNIFTAEKDDIVFAISQSGTSKQVVKAMELALARRIRTIAVVGAKNSPVSRLADYLLPAMAAEQSFDYTKTYAHLYEMAVVDVLLERITRDLKNNHPTMDIQEYMLSDLKL